MNNRRPVQILILTGIVALECLVMAGVTAFLVYELVADVPLSMASAVALLLIAALATVWLAALAFHTFRCSPWVRPGIIVWQVLQLSIAVGMFQGETARVDLGWALLIPAVAAIGLTLSRPVTAATRRADEPGTARE